MTCLAGDSAKEAALSFEELEHELKTPLASIRSLSEILRDYPDLTDGERQEFLSVMLVENERLMRAVERLLGSPALQSGLV